MSGTQLRRAGRLGVLGWPVRHSRSPAMHRAALAALGLHGYSYQLLPVPPELFEETVRALGAAGFVGANVTIPHKPAAAALADCVTAPARAIGAANTLSFSADGAIEAANTDAPGLIAALGGVPAGTAVTVLGAGGSARAAVWAMREAGADVAVWSRNPARARELAHEFGVSATARPPAGGVLVNATTVGMDRYMSRPVALRSLALDSDLLGSYALVVDFVYSSTPTPLIEAARELGRPTVDGLDILVAQGALSFERWTGVAAPVEVMARAARSA